MTERAADSEDTQEVTMSLWVVLARGARSDCFELDGITRRTIVIGSAEDAAIRLRHGGVAPVECYLERDGDEIWLFPGYRTSGLRIDSNDVVCPTRLWRRCTLEIAETRFELRIREEPPTAPDNEAPTRRFDSNGVIEAQPWQGPGFEIGSVGRDDERISVREIVAIEATEAPSVSDASVMSQATEFGESPPSSMSPTITSVRSIARGPAQQLELLGLLAQRRPWIVTLGVLVGSSAMTAVLHFGWQVARALPLQPGVGREATAAALPSMMPFCVAGIPNAALRGNGHALVRSSCRWLVSTTTSGSSGAPGSATDSPDPQAGR